MPTCTPAHTTAHSFLKYMKKKFENQFGFDYRHKLHIYFLVKFLKFNIHSARQMKKRTIIFYIGKEKAVF